MEFGRQQTSSSRLTGVVFVVLFHFAVIYVLIYGLSRAHITILPSPIETKILKENKPPPPPPPPPKADFVPPPPVYVPPPDFQVQAPASTTAIAAVTTTKPVAAPPPPPPVAATGVRVPPDTNILKGNNCPNHGQFPFPDASTRLGEHGVTTIAFLIDVTGQVLDTKIEKSSGFPRLDDATIKAIQRCHFKPGTLDGKPEQAWGRVSYNWKLED